MSADLDRGLVLFRVDAGRIAGVSMGHAFRCMALAHELEALGFQSRFLMTADPRGPEVVGEHGFEVEVIARDLPLTDLAERCRSLNPSLIVLDLLRVQAETRSFFRDLEAPVVVLDDLGGFAADCDLIVNGTAVSGNHSYESGPAKLCLGPDYMILGAEFTDPKKSFMRSELGQVLVTLGGSDPANMSLMVLESASQVIDSDRLTLVAGPAFAADPEGRERLEFIKTRFSVQENVPDLSMRMMSADLVISAGGRSAYELAALGIPALVVPTNAHEVETAQALAREGTCLAVSGFDIETCRAEIGPLLSRLKDERERRALSEAGRRLVDGRGGKRVAAEVLELSR